MSAFLSGSTDVHKFGSDQSGIWLQSHQEPRQEVLQFFSLSGCIYNGTRLTRDRQRPARLSTQPLILWFYVGEVRAVVSTRYWQG